MCIDNTLVLTVAALSFVTAGKGEGYTYPESELCPVWSTSGSCECGDALGGAIQCEADKGITSVLQGYCMTHAFDSNETLNVGRCPLYSGDPTEFRTKFNPNVTEASMCGLASNKTGFMCSVCKPGYCLPYTLDDYGKCILCNDSLLTTWIAFIALQLVPPTMIYFIIVFARIRASAPHLNMAIFFCQMMAYPRPSNLITVQATLSLDYQNYLFVFYNLWNLKLTASVVPELGVKGLDFFWASLANYIICAYLLFLASITYLMVFLYDIGFKPVVCVLRPLHKCVSCVHGPWRVSGTFIDVFVTMLVLVYWRLAITTLAVLSATTTYDSSGNTTGRWHYFNASHKYFHFSLQDGIPLIPAVVDLLASCVLVFLLFPPFILACYQFRFFHIFLNKFSCRRFRTFQLYIKTFSDYLQSCFKDGTNGTGDFRFFASFYFIIRLISAYLYYTQSLWSSPALAIVFLALLVLVCFLQPHKRPAYNTLDAAVFGVFVLIHTAHTALGMLWALSNEYSPQHGDTATAVVAFKTMTTLLLSLPLLYFGLCVAYQLLFRSRWLSRAINKMRNYREQPPYADELVISYEVTSISNVPSTADSFPHRVENPEDYGPPNVTKTANPGGYGSLTASRDRVTRTSVQL